MQGRKGHLFMGFVEWWSLRRLETSEEIPSLEETVPEFLVYG